MLRLSVLAATLVLIACASPTGASSASASNDRDCFRSLDVRSYGVVDDHRVRLHVSPSREYILTIPQQTRDLDWTHAIAVRSSTGRICTGNGIGVEIIGGDPQRTYPVSQITRAPDNAPVQGS